MSSFAQLTFFGSTSIGRPGSVEAILDAIREESIEVRSVRVGEYTSQIHAYWREYDQIPPDGLAIAYCYKNLTFHFLEPRPHPERVGLSGYIEVEWADELSPPTKVPSTCLRLTIPRPSLLTQKMYNSEANCELLLRIAKKLYAVYQPQFGWIERGVLSGYTTQGAIESLAIPHIYWANFFGSRYVEKYGLTFFQQAPGWRCDLLDDGGCMYVLFPDLNRNRAGMKALEGEIKSHFNIEAIGKKGLNRKKHKKPSALPQSTASRYPDLDERIKQKRKDGTLTEQDVAAYIIEIIRRAEEERALTEKHGLN